MRSILVASAVLAGCSSHYLPPSRGRVAVTLRDGKQAYVRDGQVYDHDLLGTSLVRVVTGNPAAEAAALEYRGRVKTGVVAVIAGVVAMTGGLTVGLAEAARSDGPSARSVEIPLLVALGGMVVMLVGAGYAATAEPYRWDAINLFNEGALLPPGSLALPVPRSNATLHMRD